MIKTERDTHRGRLTERERGLQNGAPIQKLFPGVAGGPAFVKAVSAALPMLKINPTVRVL